MTVVAGDGAAGAMKSPVSGSLRANRPADGGSEPDTRPAQVEPERPSPVRRTVGAKRPRDGAFHSPGLSTLLGTNGPLASQLPGFAHRPEQVALAHAVETALAQGRPCLGEAGTGVGKTLAYLVPLVKWLERHGGTAVVSTHTLALQAQLIERDIPTLLRALPEFDIRAAALKGRSNFLCLQDLETAAGELWTVGDPQFAQIRRWANESETGDVAELDFSFADWTEIAANADTCRQRECRYFERCFYFKARNRADECNLLVVNHALFFADLRLRRANPAGPHLLPKYDAVVFDEAHHVEDMATRAFGLEFGSRRVSQLVARARRVPGGVIDPARLASLESLNQIVFEPFLSAPNPEAFINELVREDGDRQTFAARAADLCAGLNALAKDLVAASENANDTTLRDRTAGLGRTATRLSTEVRSITRLEETETPNDEPDYFRWYQTRRGRSGQAFSTLIQTPLDVAGTLQNVLLADVPRVVFASATLASGRSFTYLKSRLGLDDPDTVEAPVEIIEGSPFDFEKNALLYVPRHLGAPAYGDGQTSYTDRVADEVIALVEASRGRAFCLFTSHRMLQAVRERLWDRTDYPLFVQGEMPNARLVDAFKASGDGVLLGTASFWEGVDVPGEALSLVILDKLPFAAPDAPAQRARETAIREEGGDAFRQFSLPQAQLRLKQGFGRLLRTTGDRGVVAILDGRLWTKNYGRDFFADLPPCPRTDHIEDVEHFFAATAASPRKEIAS